MMAAIEVNTHFFFDREAVTDALSRSEKRTLEKLGSFTRAAAKRSIRRSPKPSQPGQPPHAHTSTGSYASLENILFFYDEKKADVVIGPVKIRTNQLKGPSTASTVPQLMEEGGSLVLTKKSRSGKGHYQKRVVVDARPFMGPAQKSAAKDVDKAIKDTFY